jgi:hypothetical protein
MMYSSGKKASKAARQEARARKAAADFEAAQMEVEAGQALASGQRAVMNEDKATRIAESRALALAAASGAGASDTTVVKLISDIAAEGAYRASVARYQGEERARKLRMGAKTRRFEGEMGLAAGEAGARALSQQATANLLISGGGLLAKYGGSIFNSAGSGDSDLLMQDVDVDI